MEARPFSNQSAGSRGADVTDDDSTVEINLRVLSAILRVEMWRVMIIKKHPNDDTEKR